MMHWTFLLPKESVTIVLAGLVIGFSIGFSGVGGGSLLAPILLLLGIPPTTVAGSDLGFSFVTKSVGVGVHVRKQTVRWDWVRDLARGSIPGTIVGSLLIGCIPYAPHTLVLGFGVVLMGVACAAATCDFLRSERKTKRYESRHVILSTPREEPPNKAPLRATPLRTTFPSLHSWQISLLGGLVGLVVGTTSVGSGAFVDVMLFALSPLTAAEIVGTGIAHAILVSAVGSIIHWRLGTVDIPLVTTLLAGSLPGVLCGSMLVRRAPARPVRITVVGLVFVSGLLTAVRGL
jgi:uncharacterized membrane protein YfcA